MHEGHEIEQISDVFLSGTAIVDVASLFTVITMRGVFLYIASTLDTLWQKKEILKLSIVLISKGGGVEGKGGKEERKIRNIYDKD